MPLTVWLGPAEPFAGARPVDSASAPEGWAGLLDTPMQSVTCPAGMGGRCFKAEEGDAAVLAVGEAGSALDVAWALCAQGGLAPWASVVVVRQTAGRGQLRRPWASPAGNVYAAWRLPDALPGIPDSLASVMTGAALAEALSQLRKGSAAPLQLKWPNDFLLEGRKVGGVLLEERGGALVAGVGLNIRSAPPDGALREGCVTPAGVLGPWLKPRWREAPPPLLWAAVAARARHVCEAWLAGEDPAGTVAGRAVDRLAWLGDRVLVTASAEAAQWSANVRRPAGAAQGDFDKHPGSVVGISVHGAIRIAFEEGEAAFLSAQLAPVASGDGSC